MSFFQGLNPNKLPLAPKEDWASQKDLVPQSYHLYVLSHNKVTLPLYAFALLVVFFFLQTMPQSHCYHIIGSQTIQPKELSISQKAFFVAIKATKTTQSVHIPRSRPARVLKSTNSSQRLTNIKSLVFQGYLSIYLTSAQNSNQEMD